MGRATWNRILGITLSAIAVSFPIFSIAQKKDTVKPATFETDVAPVVTKYCISCHSGDPAPGGVKLTKSMTATAALKNPAIWARVAKNTANMHMPPPGSPQPTKEQRAKLASWVDNAFKEDCNLADPGKITIRRLNREEYNNTVRDLTGVSIRPADDFPNDDVGYGFDNIGDVLSMSPLLMEKYLAASEKVMKAAIRLPKARVQFVDGNSLVYTGGANAFEGATVMSSQSTAGSKFSVKQDGWYRIQVNAGEMHAGPDFSKLELRLNRDLLTTFEIKEPYNKTPGVYVFPIKLTVGDWNIGVTFINDFYVAGGNGRPAQDRNVYVFGMSLTGPTDDATVQTNFQKGLIPSIPPEAQWETEARKSLASFATKAYRRPITEQELDRLMVVFRLGAKSGDGYERAMQLAGQAILCNPNFLFRVELDAAGQKTRALNGYELASRLSYFIWSSMPDDQLYSLAKSGELQKPEVIKQQVTRMLADPKAEALTDNFAMQWLQLRKLYNFQPDKKQFPNFSPELVDSMVGESKAFFSSVLANDRPITEFIDSKYTFVNEQLAKHYGITGVTGNEIRKISTEGTGRGGVLTQASVLAITSNPTRTSPTKRGKWIMEQILGSPPPPPPPGVDDLKEDNAIDAKLSLRQKMEQHRKNPACAVCHIKMDALGFGFENYDAVGQWRTKDGNFAVDNSATLPDGKKFSGATQLKAVLLSNKKEFAYSFAEKMMTFALGRGIDEKDKCFVDDIVKKAAASEYKISSVIQGIVASEPFKKRKS